MNSTPMYSATESKAAARRHVVLAEQGGTLVEMALASLILIPILFGIVQLSIALYCYHYAADASREATRWAVVRGANCNLLFGASYCSPTEGSGTGAGANDIAQYVRTLGYPFSATVTTNTQWCSSGGPPAVWTSCSSTKSNIIGNQVKVTVSYSYPLIIPFLKANTINLGSTSSMTILQ